MKKADLLQLVRSWQERLDAALEKLPETLAQEKDQELYHHTGSGTPASRAVCHW